MFYSFWTPAWLSQEGRVGRYRAIGDLKNVAGRKIMGPVAAQCELEMVFGVRRGFENISREQINAER